MKKQFSVAKFGGTSVGSINAINKCLDIIKNNLSIKVIVVSAQAKVTNLLEQLIVSTPNAYRLIISDIYKIISPIANSLSAEELNHINYLFKELEILCQKKHINDSVKINDQILSFGEYISAYLVTQIFKNNNINCQYIDAKKIIKTNSEFTHAKPQIEEIRLAVEKNLPLCSDTIYILGGFIGSNENNETTTLGRGGSDYSAALIAEAINAKQLYIWTDVAGIYQADPKLIPTSKVIKKLNFDEAIELSNFGAKVLHPDTLWPTMRANIKVFIGSTFHPEKGGTWISDFKKEKHPIIRAITERKEQALIIIKFFNPTRANITYNVLDILRKNNINADLINMTETTISFTTSKNIESLKKNILNDLSHLRNISLTIEKNLSLTAIIGNNLNTMPKISDRIFKTINRSNIKLSRYGASGSSLYLLTENKSTLQKMYKTLF